MVVSIHQPCYIPYLGIFYKMSQSDIFVFLDDAQFTQGYVFNCNKIKTPQGVFNLKIPVEYSFGDNINEVRMKTELGFVEKHLKTIEMNYKKSKYFNEVFPDIKRMLETCGDNLADFNIMLMTFLARKFGFKCQIHRSSYMNITSRKEDRVIDIVKAVGGTEYLSGNGARDYQVDEHFENEGIKLTYTDYVPVVYNQLWGDFAENMSVLDYIFNEGYNFQPIIDQVKEVHNIGQ